MTIQKFVRENDLAALEEYLRSQYFKNKNTVSWLPERLHDMAFRIYAMEADQEAEKSVDYIFLWKEDGEIAACILPDGENIYFSIKEGFEKLFQEMLIFSETYCLPLFHKSPDGTTKFWVAVSDKTEYMQEILKDNGYEKYQSESYDNVAYPLGTDVAVDLPEGYQALYGESYKDEEKKWDALHLGFHPDDEGVSHENSMNPYQKRKDSPIFRDSFECLVIDENAQEENDVCAYCFVYVDMQSKTAFIEPVATREKYQHKGFGTAILHQALLRCKEKGIEKCYVDCFGEDRKAFYNAAGFTTEDSTSFWYKTIK